MPQACPEPSRRGGRRPGAGAPKGNLNALKHGGYSRQFAQLGVLLAASPVACRSLLGLLGRYQERNRKADELAAYILSQIIARGLQRGRDRLIILPPVDDAESISQNTETHEGKTVGNYPLTDRIDSATLILADRSSGHETTEVHHPAVHRDVPRR